MGDICPMTEGSTSESASGIWGDPGGRPWTVRATQEPARGGEVGEKEEKEK